MVENVHYDSRLYAHLPGMVAKGLAQAMAADGCLKMQRPPGRAQNAVGLAAAQRLLPAPTRKDKGFPCYPWKAVFVQPEGFYNVCVQCNLCFLSRLALSDGNMLPEVAICKIVDIAPGQGEQVADPQGRINTQAYHGVIAQAALFIEK